MLTYCFDVLLFGKELTVSELLGAMLIAGGVVMLALVPASGTLEKKLEDCGKQTWDPA